MDWIQWYTSIIIGLGVLCKMCIIIKGEGSSAQTHKEHTFGAFIAIAIWIPIVGRILGWW